MASDENSDEKEEMMPRVNFDKYRRSMADEYNKFINSLNKKEIVLDWDSIVPLSRIKAYIFGMLAMEEPEEDVFDISEEVELKGYDAPWLKGEKNE